MTYARDLALAMVNRHAEAGSPIKPYSNEHLYLESLLNQVENDRAHAEAKRLRARSASFEKDIAAMEFSARKAGIVQMMVIMVQDAYLIDPYVEIEGQLYRKSDGKPVTI